MHQMQKRWLTLGVSPEETGQIGASQALRQAIAPLLQIMFEIALFAGEISSERKPKAPS